MFCYTYFSLDLVGDDNSLLVTFLHHLGGNVVLGKESP
jgi:hypothetical protein